jgi:hypothetical protein
MPKQDPSQTEVDHSLILDRIYEIALEPALLDDFINLWADADLAAQFAQREGDNAGAFDAHFKSHLERAEAFLQLGDTPSLNTEDHLKPFDKFAAFVVNAALIVESVNPGAQAAFGMSSGDPLSSLNLPNDVQSALVGLVQDVLRQSDSVERLIKSENDTKQGAMLFRVIRVAAKPGANPAALVVST